MRRPARVVLRLRGPLYNQQHGDAHRGYAMLKHGARDEPLLWAQGSG